MKLSTIFPLSLAISFLASSCSSWESPSPSVTPNNVAKPSGSFTLEKVSLHSNRTSPSYKWMLTSAKLPNLWDLKSFNISKPIVADQYGRVDDNYHIMEPDNFVKLMKSKQSFKYIGADLKEEIPIDPTNDKSAMQYLARAEKINSTLTLPTLEFSLKNTTADPIRIISVETRCVASLGGMDLCGYSQLKKSSPNVIAIDYEKNSKLSLKQSIKERSTGILKITPQVTNPAASDGGGEILYQLLLNYRQGKQTRQLDLGYFLQSDNEGYPTF